MSGQGEARQSEERQDRQRLAHGRSRGRNNPHGARCGRKRRSDEKEASRCAGARTHLRPSSAAPERGRRRAAAPVRERSGEGTRRGVAACSKSAARALRTRRRPPARTSVVLASGAPHAEKMVSEPGADTPDARSAVSRARPVAGVSAIGPALGACEARAVRGAMRRRARREGRDETSRRRRRKKPRRASMSEQARCENAAARGRSRGRTHRSAQEVRQVFDAGQAKLGAAAD